MFARNISVVMADWYEYDMRYGYKDFFAKSLDWDDITLLAQFKTLLTKIEKIEKTRKSSGYIKMTKWS